MKACGFAGGFALLGIAPHRYQAKILKYPLNEIFVFFIVQKFIFIVLGYYKVLVL
ncbi:hypothetical protein [Bacillus sp. SN10]|uniref:hypothetical protein n=1 Tax=Bacillus sp. SN10 TaxID=2056493 RepID=UPI0018E3D854|nr:hypothetical protein [Bacillus sp. SN10]